MSFRRCGSKVRITPGSDLRVSGGIAEARWSSEIKATRQSNKRHTQLLHRAEVRSLKLIDEPRR